MIVINTIVALRVGTTKIAPVIGNYSFKLYT